MFSFGGQKALLGQNVPPLLVENRDRLFRPALPPRTLASTTAGSSNVASGEAAVGGEETLVSHNIETGRA